MNAATYEPPATKSELLNLYENQGMSQTEIAAHLGITQKRVQTAMRRFGIQPRRKVKRNQWGANNASWKGDRAGYSAMHLRQTALKGQPRMCEQCGSTTAKRYEWASMSGQYDDPKDYKRLCKSCHAKLDNVIRNLRSG